MKILIVDDDATTRKLLGLYLKAKGYEVAYAENGLEGIEKLGAENPNLIISDLNMPYMDGIEFVKTVRADPQQKEIPILMVTARTETADRVAGLDAGADDYVPKPYDIQEVLARVRALLRRVDTNLPSDTQQDPLGPDAPLVVGPVRLDPAARRVWSHGAEMQLSRTEFDLLELL
ncbi:MAG: response regulator transcription factor, partial [Syntrophaceae bacterium]|nr:response regulator transcription factor [Syntrophaceae bacterium]